MKMKGIEKLRSLFRDRKEPLLSIFFTAGFPSLESTTEAYLSLKEAGVHFVEIGFPFSDPIADGSTIQQSSERAIKNGMNLEVLFGQLREIKDQITMPVILMGYLNPVLRYGKERFIDTCEEIGVSGLILPDLPVYEYLSEWKESLDEKGISLIFLVTPQTTEDRIRKIDEISNTFIYAVSSQAVTGGSSSTVSSHEQEAYFKKLADLRLNTPVMVGFGIHDKASFDSATKYLDGAIIGSAFLRNIEDGREIDLQVKKFIQAVKGVS
jgi:tryptophan synthase alpha chain